MAFKKNPVGQSELRKLALDRLLKKGIAADTSALSALQVTHLIEELEIHQIELELQNENLNQTRLQLEQALTHSNELYDFSPVGNVSIDATGAITKLNLSGAHLLGNERATLIGSKLGLFLSDADRPAYNELLKRARASGEVETGELAILQLDVTVRHVQIHVACVPDDLGWQIVLVDITERRSMEEQLRQSEARWTLALEAAGDGVWDWTVKTGEVLYSKRFAVLYGFTNEELGHHIESWFERIHPHEKPSVNDVAQKCISGKENIFYSEHRVACKDGRWKWILSRGAVVCRNGDGRAMRMIGTHVDITTRKQAEDALQRLASFQQSVFDSLVAQVAVLDRSSTVLQTNQAWRNYQLSTGSKGAPDFLGDSYLDILAQLTGDQALVGQVQSGMAGVLAGELLYFQLPQPFFTTADKCWFSMKITPVHDVDERFVVSHEDVTLLKAAELASLSLANSDGLTGAKSRSNFLNLAEQELERSTRYQLPLMVLMMDLDHFKKINDLYGHAAGDEVLKVFVRTVSEVLRESDLIGRIGGEEFAVLLPNTPPEGGCALAQRIIENVRKSPVMVDGKAIHYTVSIGAGCLTSHDSFSALLGDADAALYRAKNAGRNRLEMGV